MRAVVEGKGGSTRVVGGLNLTLDVYSLWSYEWKKKYEGDGQ